MIGRLTATVVLLLSMTLGLRAVSVQERVPAREHFDRFPRQLGQWSGVRAQDFDARIISVLGLDEYLNWTLSDGRSWLGLYVGYWESQRHGDTIHSPLNCLPGSGWEPIDRRYLTVPVDTPRGPAGISVNRIVIEKGADRQVVLYWYQSRDRVVASEYAGKVYTVLDAIRYHRSDAAIVRIVSPVSRTADGEALAEQEAVSLVREIYRVLPRFIPV